MSAPALIAAPTLLFLVFLLIFPFVDHDLPTLLFFVFPKERKTNSKKKKKQPKKEKRFTC